MKMDKNTLIGFVLMALVVFGFMAYENHSRQEQMAEQAKIDSVNAVNEAKKAIEEKKIEEKKVAEKADSTNVLFEARKANEGTTIIENSLLKLTVNNKGGQICRAELKDSTYKSQEGGNVVLFDGNESNMQFAFEGKDNNIITDELYFTPTDAKPNSVTMRLPVAGGNLDISYSLRDDSYIVDIDIQTNNLSGFFPVSAKSFTISWNEHMRRQEKGFDFENRYSTITYRDTDGDTEELNTSGSDEEEDEFEEPLTWIAFKTQFFSQVLIADDNFKAISMKSAIEKDANGDDIKNGKYLKTYEASFTVPFDASGKKATNLKMYLGPNKFSTLKENEEMISSDSDLDLQSLVYLGWPVIKWINRFIFLYLFDWMTGWGIHIALVLFLITLIVKFAVFPLMKKSYLSSARMRVLKPKIDEINKKYTKPEDAMMKQQETMQLYSKYGVSPMGGCLPMLIQMPIWIALFNFIPNAIELRGQSFLWADDLSSYDDVINWGTYIWGLGDHLSLFSLLFLVAQVGSTLITMKQQQNTAMSPEQEQSMKMMKWFSYLMPLMFFFTFNGYAAGLTYYYTISAIISIIMMWYLRKTTDDAKLLAQLEKRYQERKNNPKKTSSMFEKMQALAEKQQEILRQQQEQQNKKN